MTPEESKTMSKNAVAYLRRSTDRQDQSIGDQRTAIDRYARENGFTVVREYVDDAISGADTESRKQFLKLIEDGQQRDRGFTYVLVYDVSRFGRTSMDEAGHYRHILAKAGVEVVYVAEGLRGDRMDDLMVGMKQFMAHQMVIDQSKVTLRGQLSRVGKGRWCGGRPPYGYDLVYFDSGDRPYQTIRFLSSGDRELRSVDGVLQRILPRGESLMVASSDHSRLVPGDSARVAVVQRIFDLYVNANVGLNAIADRLNQDGIPSAMGCRPGTRWKGTWSSGTIREFIRNPAYRGDTAWNRISYAKFHRVQQGQAIARPKVALGKVHRNAEADWIIVPGTHEPLVSPDDFDRAQRLLKSRAGTIGEAVRASRQNSPYLLSGLIRCSRCGTRWQGYKTEKGRKKPGEKRIATFYYCCGSYVAKGNAICSRALVRREEFERQLVDGAAEQIRAFVATGGSEILEALVLEAANPEGSASGERALKEKLADRERKLDDLIGCLTPALRESLESRILSLREQVAGIEADLDRARRARLDAAEARDLVADLVADAGRIGAVLVTATASETRELLRAIIQEVVVDPDKGEAEVTFHAIPRLRGPKRTDGVSEDDKRTRPSPSMSSCIQMAGARLVGPKRTCRVRIIRKPCLLRRHARRVAV